MSLKMLSINYPKGVISVKEMENSYGGAMLIWNLMSKKYLSFKDFEFNFDKEKEKMLWKLFSDKSIKKEHRLVLGMTYDYAVITRDNFEEMILAIDEFLKDFKVEKGLENHLPKIKREFKKCLKNQNVSFIGFDWNTISESLFKAQWNDENQSYDELNWRKYWSLFKAANK